MYLNNPLKKYIFPLITIIVASLALFALTIVSVCNEKTPNKILEEYPRLKDTKSVYEVVDAEKALRILQSGENCCMLFAFPSCPWCQQLLPVLNSTAKKCKVNKIYYVDIKNMRDNTESRDHETYLKIVELVKPALDKEKNRINAPTVIIYKNNKVVDYHLDTVESHQMEEGILPDMLPSQVSELSAILKEMLLRLK